MDDPRDRGRREEWDMAAGRVLVVDDEASVRRLVPKMLELEGYVAEGAADGAEALERLKSEPLPDLVILDIMMPGIDGFTVLRDMKSDARTAGIVVLMMSARTDRLALMTAMASGAIGLVAKPFDIDELLGIVSEALADRVTLES
jgi:CheY-like chemotaxis protein